MFHIARKKTNIKVQKFQIMCSIIRTLRHKTRLDAQLKFCKIMAVPVVTYGCENWTLNRICLDRRRIGTAEMKFLRPLASYSISDKKEYRNII